MSVNLKMLSKQLSWILRHEAERLDLAIDPEGYVRLGAVVDVIRRDHPQVTEADVRSVVEEVEQRKQRFSIAGEWIRANYGHSLAMRIAQEASAPPDDLFHGTTVTALETILLEGLRPMQRQYVHLTPDAELARSVGGRHGRSCLVRVDARQAHAAGLVFYRANRSFWLAEHVPAAFLSS
jgi:putative RNA 2'-phosphotransferase